MKNANPRAILYSLTFLVSAAALFTFLNLAPQIYSYFSLTKTVPVVIETIEILEAGENLYVPKAVFSFENMRITEILDSYSENNPYLVEEAMRSWTKGPVQGYCNHLHQCTLQKTFPVKQSVYALVLAMLALYFLFLAKKVHP